jgi:O-antigen/teichoic acid export membrane protein
MVVRRALSINALSQVITFGLGFANVVIVSRLLSPEEIGVFSVAVSVLGFAHIFREFGVGQYLVQAAEVGKPQFRAAFTVTLISAWMIAALLFMLRWPLSALYQHQGIAEVLGLVSLNFIIMPFGTPLLSMMRRELQFSRMAWATVLSAVVQTAVTIGAAWQGQSYLSMAWGSIAMHISKACILNYFRPGETFVLPTFKGISEVLKFGSLASTSSLIKELGTAAPDLIFGRTLGFAQVAIYSRGVGLQKMLVERIDGLVRGVHFPTFAMKLRRGEDGAALYAHAINHLLAVTAPLLAVLAVLAEPLILFVFGEQWRASTQVAVYICLGGILVAPYSLCSLSLVAAGKAGLQASAEIAAQSVRIAILLTSIWLPLADVVRLLLIAYLFEAFIAQQALRIAFGIRFVDLMRQVWKALLLILFAALGPLLLMVAARWSGHADTHRLALLAIASTLALLGWSMGLVLLNHPLRSEVARAHAAIKTKLGKRFGKGGGN